MNKLKNMFIVLIMAFVSTTSYALEITKNVTVTSVIPISADRPAAVGAQDYVAVTINLVDWGTPNCRGDGVLIPKTDNHLISTLLSGVAMGKPISFTIDDSMSPVYGTYCKLVYLTVST